MKNIKNQFRRAFTIVELVIVIVVIAALAAVLIPTFANVINAANESADTSLVKNLNTSLVAVEGQLEKSDDGIYNVTEAITLVRNDGYDVSKLTPSADNADIVYNASTNRFLYYTDNFADLSLGEEPDSDDVLVVIDNTLSRIATVSASESLISGNTVHYCVYSTDSEVSVEYADSTIITVWVYSENNATVTINVPTGTIYQDGECYYADVTCSDNSYHVYGKVTYVEMRQGRYVPEEQGTVGYVYVSSENKGNVTIDDVTETSTIVLSDSDSVSLGNTTADNIKTSEALENYSELFTETDRVDATCTTEGEVTYTTIFGTEVKVTLDALGHSYETTYSNPTLKETLLSGVYNVLYTKTDKCTVCNDESVTENSNDLSGDWTIDSSKTLTNYSGSLSVVEIPEGVTSISCKAFDSDSTDAAKTITKVIIPTTVTALESSSTYASGVFQLCKNLTTVEFTEGSTCTIIGGYAFYDCTSLKNITLPDSVTTIGSYAFYNCSCLEEINIPKNVTSLGGNSNTGYVFRNCTSLKTVYYNAIDVSSSSSGTGIFGTYNNSTNGVTVYIGANVVNFYKIFQSSTYLKQIIFEENSSCTRIELAVFFNCTALTSINIPKSVTYIEKMAFWGCSALTTVTFENPDNWYYSSSKLDTPTTANCTANTYDFSDSTSAATYLTGYSYYLNSYLYNNVTKVD